MQYTRWTAIKLWILCLVAVIPLLILQILQALFGSPDRSVNMALSMDECGNSLLGGVQYMTISARTGLGVIAGLRWAKIVAPIIDFFFGSGHCASAAASYNQRPLTTP